MKVAETLGRSFVTVTSAFVSVPCAYLGLLTVVAPWRQRRIAARLPSLALPTDAPRFAIIVPAHDEAGTIEVLLNSLVGLQWPRDRVDVHVVADNCSDETAAIVRSFGFEAHERTDDQRPGKGPALNWLFRRLVERSPSADIYVYVDADSELAPDYLSALADVFHRPDVLAVQGHYGVRAPESSPAIALRYCALACRHHLRPLARNAIGGSCGLFGNGMAFRRQLIDAETWTDHLVEDMELQLKLLRDGVIVHYAPRAHLQAEMPHSLGASVTQNQRWELGRRHMIRTFAPGLLRSVVKRRDQRVARVDALLDMAVPPLSVLATASSLSTISAVLLHAARPSPTNRKLVGVTSTFSAILVMHVFVALRLVRAPRVVYRALLAAPRFVVWKLGLLTRLVGPSANVAWIRTSRNAQGTGDVGS